MTRRVWIDLETTGLNPRSDIILEIGVVITDLSLETVWEYAAPVAVDVEAARAMCDEYALNMHEENGLWADLRTAKATPLADIIETVCTAVHEHGAFGGPAGGLSVHFDRAFLKEDAPEIDALFNHRCFDVSTMKDWFRTYKGEFVPEPACKGHRALADCREAIDTLKALRGRTL